MRNKFKAIFKVKLRHLILSACLVLNSSVVIAKSTWIPAFKGRGLTSNTTNFFQPYGVIFNFQKLYVSYQGEGGRIQSYDLTGRNGDGLKSGIGRNTAGLALGPDSNPHLNTNFFLWVANRGNNSAWLKVQSS